MRAEVSELRSMNKELDTIKFEQEKEINQHKLQRVALEQQIHDKDELYAKTMALLNSSKEQKDSLESALEAAKSQNAKLEESVRKATYEITKVIA